MHPRNLVLLFATAVSLTASPTMHLHQRSTQQRDTNGIIQCRLRPVVSAPCPPSSIVQDIPAPVVVVNEGKVRESGESVVAVAKSAAMSASISPATLVNGVNGDDTRTSTDSKSMGVVAQPSAAAQQASAPVSTDQHVSVVADQTVEPVSEQIVQVAGPPTVLPEPISTPKVIPEPAAAPPTVIPEPVAAPSTVIPEPVAAPPTVIPEPVAAPPTVVPVPAPVAPPTTITPEPRRKTNVYHWPVTVIYESATAEYVDEVLERTQKFFSQLPFIQIEFTKHIVDGIGRSQSTMSLQELADWRSSSAALRAQTVILLTERDLDCKRSRECVGQATYGGFCNGPAIVEGLTIANRGVVQIAETMTHELGHLIGMVHEGETQCANDSNTIMLDSGVAGGRFRWSSCSIAHAQAYIQQNGHCLNR